MSTTKARIGAGPTQATGIRRLSAVAKLGLLLLAGLAIRLAFIGNEGFKNDVSSFEAWAIALANHPFAEFYNPRQFADYPPGYFYVLWIVGHIYQWIAPGNLGVLKALVKLPAILMDLADALLIFAVVRRFASERWAFLAAAVFVFNPAAIFISAAWGQVDSVSGGLALLAIYLLLRSNDTPEDRFSWQIALAWFVLGYSLLIKPQAAVLVPLFLAFAFTSPQRTRVRLIATGAGILAAIVFAWLLSLPFHLAANPASVLEWLYGRYAVGKNVYPYNSVNAFNLWSIVHPFWQADSAQIGFAAQYIWGIVLVVAATALIVVRYLQERTERSLVEAAALLALAFFMLATRMHERYVYDGLLLTIAAMPFAARYRWAAAIFSMTLLVNLFYSLAYLAVVLNSTPGVNPTDMWPGVRHTLSILNVAVFFWLGYVYLGQAGGETAQQAIGAGALNRLAARNWFNPREGLATMIWPLDYLVAGIAGVISFGLSFVNYWKPGEKIFDEIYFARAAEEYLTHKYIYENTHPPLTKLIITISTMLFGGMHGGDNAHGWRFLDVVFGALAVVVLYAFAKRLTRSTLFASIAAVLLVADGMHFVQSRIATPEGIVVVFSLGALYAFYRYWIAAQSTQRRYEPDTLTRAGVSALVALIGGLALAALTTIPFGQSKAALAVFTLYFASGIYLVLRLWIVPRFRPSDGEFISYAEGTQILARGSSLQITTGDGTTLDPRRKSKGSMTAAEGDLRITYSRDGSVEYATPEGSATYSPGLVVDDEGESQQGIHAKAWLVTFTVLLGLLVASKWYGVMAYGVSFVVIAAVWLQRYWASGKAKQWGNPFGFRLDLSLAAIAFLSMTVYLLVWIPDFIRQIEIHNLTDLVYRQYSMFEYHDTLKATHPYASAWWSWPIDLRPIAYYWKDTRVGAAANMPNACCVAEITSMPNPIIMWFGLFCVPFIGFLAWRERNKAFALLVLAYLLQWLPWARSPRITFIYHFYVDIPIIILCNVLVLQRIWQWNRENPETRLFGWVAVGGYVLAAVWAFAFFYPILSGTPIPWNHWHARMWIDRWVI